MKKMDSRKKSAKAGEKKVFYEHRSYNGQKQTLNGMIDKEITTHYNNHYSFPCNERP